MADSTYLPPIIPKTPEVVDQYLVEYYRKVGEFCDECYQEGLARQKSAPELKAMDEAIDYLAGIQWRDKLPSYRPKPVSNEVLSNFWETIGLLTDTRPIFHISEAGNLLKDLKDFECDGQGVGAAGQVQPDARFLDDVRDVYDFAGSPLLESVCEGDQRRFV